jgi:tryptophanyl-tRNA synthetase
VHERYQELAADPSEVARQLETGAEKARAIAEPVLERTRQAVGLLPPAG